MANNIAIFENAAVLHLRKKNQSMNNRYGLPNYQIPPVFFLNYSSITNNNNNELSMSKVVTSESK